MFSHRFDRPSAQRGQTPQRREGLTATGSPTFNAGAGRVDFGDLAGELMAEDQRLGEDKIAGAAMTEIMQVAAADAAGT